MNESKIILITIKLINLIISSSRFEPGFEPAEWKNHYVVVENEEPDQVRAQTPVSYDFHQILNMDSCFLKEMKFISKLLPKFRRQIWCQEIPRLRLFIISSYYHKIIIKISDLQNFKSSNFEISNLQISKFQNPKVRYTGLFENFEILRFSDLKNPYFLRMFQYFSLYFLK